MLVCMEKRFEYFNHFVAQHFMSWPNLYLADGRVLTPKRLSKYQDLIVRNDNLWFDVVIRHGGDKCIPEAMKAANPDIYEHCRGNFWGQVLEIIEGYE